MSNGLTKKKKRPFIIHYCGTKQECTCEKCKKEEEDSGGLFSTHTHGLDKVNHPEMFIDPLAFAKYNSTLINNAYDYLNRSDNKNLVQDIIDGKTLEISIHKLDKKRILIPGIRKDLIVCIRAVYSDFEAVKEAYGYGIPPDLPFLQLYVLGDDFALEDEYYEGGVTW